MIRGQVKRLTLDTTIPIERLLYPALPYRWTTSADFTLMAMFPLPFTGSYSHPSIGEVVNGELWLSTDTIKHSHVFPTYFCVIGPRSISPAGHPIASLISSSRFSRVSFSNGRSIDVLAAPRHTYQATPKFRRLTDYLYRRVL